MRFILIFLSLLYNILTSLRNFLFNYKILNSIKYDIPIICVGNLEVGGTGKTPHVQYIINILKKKYNIAVLSRGYKRKSSNLLYVEVSDKADLVGDEPLLIKKNNPNCLVVVEKNRNKAVRNIIKNHPETNVIILDDGYQHRWINPGLNILLTNYEKPYYNNHLMPLGRLRESYKESKRSDLIVLTKTKNDLTKSRKDNIIKKIKPKNHQKVFFSNICYLSWRNLFSDSVLNSNKKFNIILITGISNAKHLKNHLTEQGHNINHINFPDHYSYSKLDINNIVKEYNLNKSKNKVLLTTEKDAVKLRQFKNELYNTNVYYICIGIKFNNQDQFDKMIINYVRKSTTIS